MLDGVLSWSLAESDGATSLFPSVADSSGSFDLLSSSLAFRAVPGIMLSSLADSSLSSFEARSGITGPLPSSLIDSETLVVPPSSSIITPSTPSGLFPSSCMKLTPLGGLLPFSSVVDSAVVKELFTSTSFVGSTSVTVLFPSLVISLLLSLLLLSFVNILLSPSSTVTPSNTELAGRFVDSVGTAALTGRLSSSFVLLETLTGLSSAACMFSKATDLIPFFFASSKPLTALLSTPVGSTTLAG